nr:putative integron gene cassette protein [uncultured bacterium]
MRKWLYVVLFVACVGISYLLRGAVDSKIFTWIAVGSFTFVVLLKVVQIALMHYVKVQEEKMSPDERREFEEYKKQHATGGKSRCGCGPSRASRVHNLRPPLRARKVAAAA